MVGLHGVRGWPIDLYNVFDLRDALPLRLTEKVRLAPLQVINWDERMKRHKEGFYTRTEEKNKGIGFSFTK